MNDHRGRQSNGFFWGGLLIVLGTAFLLEQNGIIPEIYWGGWWPTILILFGLLRLMRPAHAGHVGSGVNMVLLGLWFLAVEFEWHGLDWHNSWPLALVAIGCGMVTRAIAARFMPDRGELGVRS